MFMTAAMLTMPGLRGTSRAQTPTAGAPAAPAPAAGWQNGFFLQSADGNNRLQFGLVLQMDGRFSLDDPAPFTDTFTLRKARPVLQGRVARYFDYRLMPEFGSGAVTLMDAYVDVRVSPVFRLRTGKDKTPIGYELLIGDPALLFPERSLSSSLVPNRDIGIQAMGELAGGKVSYSAGIFNGVADGASSITEVDGNQGKDLAGRVVFAPFRTSTTPPGALNGLGFQVGGSTGSQIGALPTFRTTSGLQTYFSYVGVSPSAPAAVAAGDRSRVTPAVFYFYKSFGAFGEYVRSTQDVSRADTSRPITNQSWEITGSYLLSGEAASTSVPAPRQPFDPAEGGRGAWQIVGRYAQLTVDDDAFDAGFAAAGSSQEARAVAVGLNWYPVQPIKYYFSYERTMFEGPTPRATENTILFRFQLAF